VSASRHKHMWILQMEMDFELLYPDVANALFETWPQLAPKILEMVKKNVMDKHIQQILTTMAGDASKGK